MEALVLADATALEAHLDDMLRPRVAGHEPAVFDAGLVSSTLLTMGDDQAITLAPRLLPKLMAILRVSVQASGAIAAAAALTNGLSSSTSTTSSSSSSSASAASSFAAAADRLPALAERLLKPLSFDACLTLLTENDLVTALDPETAPESTHAIAMQVLDKATVMPASAASGALLRLATFDRLLPALVTCWLTSTAASVGDVGGRLLGNMLDLDCPLPLPPSPALPLANGVRQTPNAVHNEMRSADMMDMYVSIQALVRDPPERLPMLRQTPGPGRLWQLFFSMVGVSSSSSVESPLDTPLAGLMVRICRGDHPATRGDTRRQSHAQTRLMPLIVRLAALDLHTIAMAPIISSSSGGDSRTLLHYALVDMVDLGDLLAERAYFDFVSLLVCVMRLVAASDPDGTMHSAATQQLLRTNLRAAMAAHSPLNAILHDVLLQVPIPDVVTWLDDLMASVA